MKYLNAHLTNIKYSATFPISRLEKGMIIKVTYSPVYKEGDRNKSGTYLLLVLNGKYKEKVHALSMDEISPQKFKDLAKKTGLTYLWSDKRFRKLDIPKLFIDLSSFRFYHRILKSAFQKRYNNAYRTMIISQFGNVKVVNYDFPAYLKTF